MALYLLWYAVSPSRRAFRRPSSTSFTAFSGTIAGITNSFAGDTTRSNSKAFTSSGALDVRKLQIINTMPATADTPEMMRPKMPAVAAVMTPTARRTPRVPDPTAAATPTARRVRWMLIFVARNAVSVCTNSSSAWRHLGSVQARTFVMVALGGWLWSLALATMTARADTLVKRSWYSCISLKTCQIAYACRMKERACVERPMTFSVSLSVDRRCTKCRMPPSMDACASYINVWSFLRVSSACTGMCAVWYALMRFLLMLYCPHISSSSMPMNTVVAPSLILSHLSFSNNFFSWPAVAAK
mmetsp:Transcript_15006/g.38040  ORF Transcript_15006/g.38040 Transcript_15006/m.38040 type:complete len:300 (-) Transcript_15006:1916-2815(-)